MIAVWMKSLLKHGLGLAAVGSLVFAASAEEDMLDRDMIVLAAPSIEDASVIPEYMAVFHDIVDFHVAYAKEIDGRDLVRIVVDDRTRSYYEGRVPDHVLTTGYIPHIWMRDFGPVNPYDPVLFRYTAASFEGDQDEADFLQSSFTDFVASHGIAFPTTDLILDGGNIVDNYAGRVVTTTRFLEDNNLSMEEGKRRLKKLLNAKQVAILPPDDPVLAHSDGMVMFAKENTIIMNYYDEPLRTEILKELESAFPGIEIVEIDADWDDEVGEIGSACGINVNAVVTRNYIYMPHFGNEESEIALEVIQDFSDKTVVAVPTNSVCKLGGTVRCLSWQTTTSLAGAL